MLRSMPVLALWRKRRADGVKQSEVAAILNCDPGWVSKQFRGPGNWTLRTIGELIEALDGDIEIAARPMEETSLRNFDAYSGYGADPPGSSVVRAASTQSTVVTNDALKLTATTATSTASVEFIP